MKKLSIILFIIMCIVSFRTNAQYSNCNCATQPSGPTAILNVKGVPYMCMSPAATITIPAIDALFGTTGYTGDISAGANSVCAGPPLTPGGPSACTFGRATDNFNIKNSTTPPAGVDYTGSPYTQGVTARVTLPVGISLITVYAKCMSNVAGPGGSYESRCPTGTFSVTVLPPPPPFAVSISNQCHTIIPSGQSVPVNSGNHKFRINFSSPPPQGTIVMLLKNNSVVEQRPASQFNINTDYFFENSSIGYGNGNYNVKLVYNNAEIFATNLPVGYTYNITRRNLNCQVLVPHNPNLDVRNATPRTLP